MPEGLPSFSDYVLGSSPMSQWPSIQPAFQPPVPSRPAPPPEVPATGTGDWFTSGIMSGFHGAISEGARALQAVAQGTGASGAAQSLSDFAEEHHARAQSYARPDLEASPWSPAGIAYQVARMAPMGLAAFGGGALAAATAPEAAAGASAAAIAAAARAAATRGLAGAATTMYLPAAGANVEREISETGELKHPGTALALGVPEAVVQGYLPAKLESLFGKGILRGIAHSAAAQGVAGGATEAMTQLLGDPDRSMADRASAVTQQALSGGVIGGIIGGAFGGLHALAGKPAQSIRTEDLGKSVDQALEPPAQPDRPGPVPFTPSEPPAGAPSAEPELPQRLPLRPIPGGPEPPGRGAPSLQEMPSAELSARLDSVQGHLKSNPQDATAQRAFELLGEEAKRRTEPVAPAEPGATLAPPAPEVAPREEPVPAPGELPPAVAEQLPGPVPVPGEPPAVAGAPGEPLVAVAPAAEPPPYVIDFTKGRIKEATAEYEKVTPEAQAEMVQPLIDQIIERGGKPTKPQEKWIKALGLDILDKDTGYLKSKLVPERPVEEPPGVTAEPPAEPTTPAEKRAAVLGDVAKQASTLPESPAKAQLLDKVEQITNRLPGAERNPGFAKMVDKELAELSTTAEKLSQPPADQVAPPDLAPSPRAEAVPAPTGDLDAKLTDAQKALDSLRKTLGNRPEAVAAIEQHENWLKAVRDEDLQKALAENPEANPEADNLGGLRQLSKSTRDEVNAYLTQHESVLQSLRADGGYARAITSRDGLPVTQLDADVTDLHQRGVTLVDTMAHVAEQHPDAAMAEIALRLAEEVPKDITTTYRPEVTHEEGRFFPRQKSSELYNAADATQTAMHEAVHAVTHKGIDDPNSVPGRKIRDIYDQLKDRDALPKGLTDAHELTAEAYTNPVTRDWLRSQIVKGTSFWDRFVDAVRGMLGIPPRLFNALDRIMSHGDDLMKEQQQYANSWVGPDSYARVLGNAMSSVSNNADQGLGSILRKAWLNFNDTAGKYGLGWATDFRIGQLQGRIIPSMQPYVEATGPRQQARKEAIGMLGQTAEQVSNALPVEERDLVNKVMRESNGYGVDPQRPLSAQPDLHNDPDRVNRLASVTADYNQLSPEGKKAFEFQRATSSSHYLMTLVDDMQQVERTLSGGLAQDRFDDFTNRTGLYTRPDKAEGFWKQAFTDEQTALTDRRNALSGDRANIDTQLAAKPPPPPDQVKELTKQRDALQGNVDAIDDVLKDTLSKRDTAAKAPHFHQGRNGDFFVLNKLFTDPDGTVNQQKLTQFADRLEKTFPGVTILEGSQNDTAYMRVKSAGQMDMLFKAIKQAQADGLISPTGAARGEVTDPHIFNALASPAMLRKVVEQMRSLRGEAPAGATSETIDALNKADTNRERDLRRILLNTMQENSMGRLMAQRHNVPGYNADMIREAANASKIMANSLARTTLAPEVGELQAKMRDELTALKENPDISSDALLGASRAVSELLIRDGNKQSYASPTPFDALRRFSHTASVGSSPIYPLTLASQNLTTTLPEFLKLHSPVASMRAMAGAAPDAWKLLAAVMKTPNWDKAGITDDAIANSGLSAERQAQARAMIAGGSLQQVYSAEMTDHSPMQVGHNSTGLKLANAMGFYSEQLPRLLAGFAAHDLYDSGKRPTSVNYRDMTAEQYANHVMDQTQGTWGAGTPRQLTTGGMFGTYSPVFNQFMNWSTQMTGKMYQELRDSFKGDKDTRSEAQRWLLAHAGATTMLAGVLGLPALSVMSSVYDRLMNWVTNRDDHDLTASTRTFLADTFGKDMGEVIARGLPRAIGVDFGHWGEATTVPGSSTINMLLEKRKFDDAWRDWAKSMTGAGVGNIPRIVLGIRDISNGDYLNGLIRMSPEILKAPSEAFRLAEHGFVNHLDGTTLPIGGPGGRASTMDVMLTALGIKPEKQAEYEEVAREEFGLRTMRQLSHANISQHLQNAWMQHDTGMFHNWMIEAQKWQVDHPGLMPPQATFGRALDNHIRQSAMARGMGLPLGVQPRDIAGRGMLQYGNIRPVQ